VRGNAGPYIIHCNRPDRKACPRDVQGPEYPDEEVKKVVQRSKFKAEYIGEDAGVVADLVAKGEIVAWYQGRAELGPRALGNRSIVADPTGPSTGRS